MQKVFDPHTYGELNVTMPTFQWKWLIYWALPTSPDLNDLSSLGPWFDPFFCHLPHPFFRCFFRLDTLPIYVFQVKKSGYGLKMWGSKTMLFFPFYSGRIP